MQQFTYSALSKEHLSEICKRPEINLKRTFDIVSPIIERVRSEGDSAVLEYTRTFDKVDLDRCFIPVPKMENVALPDHIKHAFDTAYANISAFHLAQQLPKIEVETMPGLLCSQIARPIEHVGCYVPGGTAVLPSSVLMLGVPAQIAGCSTLVIATPPRKDGSISDEVLYCAALVGATGIVTAGGAQAVAAMAYGTESVPKVDLITGPGNQFVTAAKMLLQQSDASISIDMPAGPSEVLVIADKSANPAFIAADLLSQAEHGVDSQVMLVAIAPLSVDEVRREIHKQLEELPRKEMAQKALDNSVIVVVDTVEEALHVSNTYAPEHLILQCEDSNSIVDGIQHAGSIFVGHWTPESLGDYASGTNHTLPTYGYARMYSGVSLSTYQKKITVQSASPEGLKNIGKTVEIMAEVEGLQAHKNAVTIRLNALKVDSHA